MRRRVRGAGFIIVGVIVTASCHAGEQEPLALDVAADADATAAAACARCPSVSFRHAFTSGPGGDAPPWYERHRSLPEAKALVVGPEDDIWLAGRFFAPFKLGAFELTSAGSGDVFVARLDRAGNPRWAIRFGGPEDEECGGIAVDAEGDVLVAYQVPVHPPPRGYPGPILLAKLGPSGEMLWEKTVLPPGRYDTQSRLVAAAGDLAGGIVLVAREDTDGATVARLNTSGDELWSTRAPAAEAEPVELAVDLHGNAILGEGSTVGPRVRLVEISGSGVTRVNKLFRGHGDGINLESVASDPRGNVLLSGFGGVALGSQPTPPEQQGAPWIGKLDASGNLLWQRFGITGRVAADDQGNVIHASFGSVGKLDPAGGCIWECSPRVDGRGGVGAVATDSAGRVIIAGTLAGRMEFGDGVVESGERPALFVIELAD